MVLRLMEEGRPLTSAVFFDTGMEFKAIYNVLDKIEPEIRAYGADFRVLKPENDFLVDMLLRPVHEGTEKERYGWDWCGGCARWRTSGKITAIQKYLNSLHDDYVQYIGIAADEPNRIKNENGKTYPLVEWGMKESECLQYCYEKGYDWKEDGIELYSILDRVSCWCCTNKNLKELRNIRKYAPRYWGMLKGLQSRIDRPFKSNGQTVFDLDKRFQEEEAQTSMFDIISDVGQVG